MTRGNLSNMRFIGAGTENKCRVGGGGGGLLVWELLTEAAL